MTGDVYGIFIDVHGLYIDVGMLGIVEQIYSPPYYFENDFSNSQSFRRVSVVC